MRRGQMTVFFSLLLPLLLALLGTAMESAARQSVHSRMQRGLMLCEQAVLSEYQKELWERYGIFCLDTAYGGGEESLELLKGRMLSYLEQNLSLGEDAAGALTAPEVWVGNIEIGNLRRLTDHKGMEFYEQAVAFEKNLWGVEWMDSWKNSMQQMQELIQLEQAYEQAEETEKRNLEILRERRLETEEVDTPDPAEDIWQGADGILTLVVEDTKAVSAKSMSRIGIPSSRSLLEGTETAGRYAGNLENDQWFHTYLLERCTNAKEVFLQNQEVDGWLSYEVEYILAGKNSDVENLKAVVNRLLLLREGVNYAYLLTDEARKQEAYVLAAVIAGITFMPEIVDALHQVILLGWAYGESVLDVRSLLMGNKVGLMKTSESWKLPLSKLLFFRSHVNDYDETASEEGLDYEGYLRLLLTVTGREEKCMRGLDVVEGNLRNTTLGKSLYVDQCVDEISVRVELQYRPKFSGFMGDMEEEHILFVADRKWGYRW